MKLYRYRAQMIWVIFIYFAVEYVIHAVAAPHAVLIDIVEAIPSAAAALVLFAVFRQCAGDLKKFWLMLALGSLSFTFAMLISDGYRWFIGAHVHIPRWVDFFWNAQSVLFLAAFYLLIYEKKKTLYSIRFLFDASTLLIVLAVFSWEFVFKSVLNEALAGKSVYDHVVTIGYPLSDVLIFAALLLVYFSANRIIPAVSFRWLAAGFICLIFADLEWTFLSEFHLYMHARWFEPPFYTAGFLLTGFAGIASLEQKPADEPEEDTAQRIHHPIRAAVPYIAVILLLVYMVFREGIRDGVVLGSAAAALMILIRQVTVLKENRNLLRSLRQSLEQTEKLANVDTLTDLLNRRSFKLLAADELDRASLRLSGLAILFADLDKFKAINDLFGHNMGDSLLQVLGARFVEVMGSKGLVARLGGDEFAFLIRRYESAEELEEIARQIIQVSAIPIHIEECELLTTASVGIACYPEHGRDLQQLMQNADTAMYCAKKSGRDNYQFYHKEMQADTPKLRRGKQVG